MIPKIFTLAAALCITATNCKTRSSLTKTKSSEETKIDKKAAKEALENLTFDEFNTILKKGRVWNGSLAEIKSIIAAPTNAMAINKQDNSPTLLSISDRKANPSEAFNGEKQTFTSNQLIECDYVEPDVNKPFGGYSPKYHCLVKGEKKPFKIKYDETGKLQADTKGTLTVPGINGPKFSPSSPLDIFPNLEVYGEVAASQLLHMLGFEVDRNYPVQVFCKNCPADPFTHSGAIASVSRNSSLFKLRLKFVTRNFVTLDFNSLSAGGEAKQLNESSEVFKAWEKDRKDRYYPLSLIEIKNKGLEVQFKQSEAEADKKASNEKVFTEGFSLRTYARNESIDSNLDNETRQLMRIEREAFAFLLGGFLQHADSKDDNQRIVCPKEQVIQENGKFSCKQATLMAHDLGWTFGDGNQPKQLDTAIKMNFKGWKHVHIFKDRPTSGELKETSPAISKCVINVNGQFHETALKDFYIYEESRRLASAWLNALNDDELTNLFDASRISKVGLAVVNGQKENPETLAKNLVAKIKSLNKTLSADVQSVAGDALTSFVRAAFVARASTAEWKRIFVEKRMIINNTICEHKMLDSADKMAWDGSNKTVPLDALTDGLTQTK